MTPTQHAPAYLTDDGRVAVRSTNVTDVWIVVDPERTSSTVAIANYAAGTPLQVFEPDPAAVWLAELDTIRQRLDVLASRTLGARIGRTEPAPGPDPHEVRQLLDELLGPWLHAESLRAALPEGQRTITDVVATPIDRARLQDWQSRYAALYAPEPMTDGEPS